MTAPHNTSLYDRWAAVAREFSREMALCDGGTGQRWTFGELFHEGERCGDNNTRIIFPRGNDARFILSVIRAWRAGRLVCPLESGQQEPAFLELPAHCAHLKLTSASSGTAKCVAMTGLQLAADAANIVSTMGLRSQSPNIGCISLAHSYGFSNLITPLLLHGIPLILVPAPLPELVFKAASSFPDVTLAAVPALWRTWHQTQCISKSVKLAISAGAPLPLDLEAEVFASCGLKLHNFYGSSECGGIAYDRSASPRTEAELAGTAMDGVHLSLSDAGTIVVESSAVAETYWPEPSPVLGNGRFETSDLARIENNSVYLEGRATDVINVAGRKVPPESIEAALRRHPEVIDCVVFGAPDPENRFESIAACVRTRQSVAISDLAKFLSGSIPAWQIPRRWWFTDELAPNCRGKIARAEWRDRFLKQNAAQ
jgi:acyl-coenzyme A synthetase/AMP-(fatty) acid ligase